MKDLEDEVMSMCIFYVTILLWNIQKIQLEANVDQNMLLNLTELDSQDDREARGEAVV